MEEIHIPYKCYFQGCLSGILIPNVFGLLKLQLYRVLKSNGIVYGTARWPTVWPWLHQKLYSRMPHTHIKKNILFGI